MIHILFVCHGNICRSPMAQSVMAHLVQQRGLSHILVDSAATSSEEVGNCVHPGTQRVLAEYHIPLVPHRARLMTRQDGETFDYLIGMDSFNLRNMARITGSMDKIHGLLDWSSLPRDIADPWYTGDFEATFRDVWDGCHSLLEALLKENAPA